MAIGNAAGTANRPVPKRNITIPVPAPFKGVDSRIAFIDEAPAHCVYTYNAVPYEQGLKVRSGYREWQEDTLNLDTPVGTIIPFESAVTAGADNRLFSVNNNGIYDNTTYDTAPVLKLAFADTSPAAGHGVYCHYTGNAGEDVLFYADSLNGLFTYDSATDTWAQASSITGLTVEDVRFVTLHKDRLWFLVEDSTVAYYLDVGAIAGTVTEFYLGSKFRHGGNAAGIFSWSVDGGDGVADYFVAVSRAGDVIVYEGADPSNAANWNQKAQYYIGQVPVGARFGTESTGELYLLSIYGLTGMSDLLAGVDSMDYRASSENTSPSAKITSLIRDRIAETQFDYGWSVQLAPTEGSLIITSPQVDTNAPIQYVYNLATAAWGFYRDVPITAFDTWESKIYFGDPNNRILVMDVPVDNVLINPTGEVNGDDIEFSGLTMPLALGDAGMFKQVSHIRADFRSLELPDVATRAVYDYSTTEQTLSSTATATPNTARWDASLWDVAVWGSRALSNYNNISGSLGIGRRVSVAYRGTTRAETYIIGFDLTFTTGGAFV